MMSDGASFLPRILSVFYAVFDVNKGPMIVYQVPEGLIAAPSSGCVSSPDTNGFSSRTSSSSRNSRQLLSPRILASPHQKRSTSANNILFNFEDISRYVIPQSQLCGRLVICAARKHRVIGFPVELYGERYERNYFRYNLCFVFDRSADLSCYEPIVRKIGRVLTACEEESYFLSSPDTSPTVHAILEQLYEDLNSYSETSISIDMFNSIELKIFPFYPNPPPVHDWMVPVALINLTKRIEANWDLTMAKVCPYIDGTNHVSRIADLADCDIDLARKAISHLLYYQVIMMIDIFQYSNMYTLRKSIQWLADELHVRDECGPYVTKPDRDCADWPKLLFLYSRLKHGKTVLEWMQDHDVHQLGIDPRRFTSFGVIKGFLRRVHRWPVLLPETDKSEKKPASIGRRRGFSLLSSSIARQGSSDGLDKPAYGSETIAHDGTRVVARTASKDSSAMTSPSNRTSLAEQHLDLLRREIDAAGAGLTGGAGTSRSVRVARTKDDPLSFTAHDTIQRRHTLHQPYSSVSSLTATSTLSASLAGLPLTADAGEHSSGAATPTRPRLSRSPSSQTNAPAPALVYPPELKNLLDGTRNSDELGVQFEAGWPLLEKYLVAIGGGKGNGDFGRVEIIYR